MAKGRVGVKTGSGDGADIKREAELRRREELRIKIAAGDEDALRELLMMGVLEDDEIKVSENLLDVSERELLWCEEWVRSGGVALDAARYAGYSGVGVDSDGVAKEMLERAEVRYIVGLMRRVVRAEEDEGVEVDILDLDGNRNRVVRDLRKIRKETMRGRDWENAIKTVELEGKVTEVLTDRRSVKLDARVVSDPRSLSLSEMRRLLTEDVIEGELVEVPDNLLIDVTPKKGGDK